MIFPHVKIGQCVLLQYIHTPEAIEVSEADLAMASASCLSSTSADSFAEALMASSSVIWLDNLEVQVQALNIFFIVLLYSLNVH